MPDQATMQVDWDTWTPQTRATLLFVKRGEEVLLIRKKRGLGAGKINGPGGKIDEGEEPLASAIREVQEEVGITPINPSPRGELHFQFTDGLALHCTVFLAEEHEGEAIETDEALPIWTPINAIPYEEMWKDDQFWLPQVLAGGGFKGWFVFDGDEMLEKQVIFEEEDSVPTVDGEPAPTEPKAELDEGQVRRLSQILESLLIASEAPLSAKSILKLLRKAYDDAIEEGTDLGTAWTKKVSEADLHNAVRLLREDYESQGRAFTVAERAAGWKIFTTADFAPWVRAIYPEQKPTRLSAPALETLAIIAYRQPITKADVEAVRGVNIDGVMKVLLDRGLVRIGGRAEAAGRPLLYETTEVFLDHFGIKTVDDLPNASELRQVKFPTAAAPSELSEEEALPAPEPQASE